MNIALVAKARALLTVPFQHVMNGQRPAIVVLSHLDADVRRWTVATSRTEGSPARAKRCANAPRHEAKPKCHRTRKAMCPAACTRRSQKAPRPRHERSDVPPGHEAKPMCPHKQSDVPPRHERSDVPTRRQSEATNQDTRGRSPRSGEAASTAADQVGGPGAQPGVGGEEPEFTSGDEGGWESPP